MPKDANCFEDIRKQFLEDTGIVIKGVVITDAVVFTGDNYKAKWVKFIDIDFRSDIVFKSCFLGFGVIFERCEFKGVVKILGVEAIGYDKSFSNDSVSIRFEDCRFGNKFILGRRSIIDRDLSLKKCAFLDDLTISELQINDQSLSILDNTFGGKCDIEQIQTKQNITLANNTFEEICRIESCKSSFLVIVKNVSKKNVLLTGNISSDGIAFNDGVFEDEITLNCSDTPKKISIIGGLFKSRFNIEYKSRIKGKYYGPQSYYIHNAMFENGLYAIGTTDLGDEFPRITSVEIDCSKLKGEIVFSNFEIGTIDLTGYNATANLSFENIYVNRLKVKRFFNFANLILSNIKGSYKDWFEVNGGEIKRKNTINISETNLGKSQFYQVDFSSFDIVSIHNAILSEINTSLVKWFLPNKLMLFDDRPFLDAVLTAKKRNDFALAKSQSQILYTNYQSVREVYRQLKIAMQRQGDKPQALYFQQLEMVNFKKMIDLNTTTQNNNDKWILLAGTTNDFGQNWLKPAMLLLISAFILFIPIALLASPNIDLTHLVFSFENIKNNLVEIFYYQLGLYPQLLNPAHSLNLILHNENAPGLIYFFDFIHRVITSFFIYQIISAFRKYAKS